MSGELQVLLIALIAFGAAILLYYLLGGRRGATHAGPVSSIRSDASNGDQEDATAATETREALAPSDDGSGASADALQGKAVAPEETAVGGAGYEIAILGEPEQENRLNPGPGKGAEAQGRHQESPSSHFERDQHIARDDEAQTDGRDASACREVEAKLFGVGHGEVSPPNAAPRANEPEVPLVVQEATESATAQGLPASLGVTDIPSVTAPRAIDAPQSRAEEQPLEDEQLNAAISNAGDHFAILSETELPLSDENATSRVVGVATDGAKSFPAPPEPNASATEGQDTAAPPAEKQPAGAAPNHCGSAPELQKGRTSRSTTNNEIPPRPRKYRGLTRTAPQPQDGKTQPSPAASRDRALPIEVRLRFDRDGFCRVSLIARRTAALPEDMSVATRSGELDLRAMQDEWYQDIVLDDLSRVLHDGAVWTALGANERSSWSLSGRDLFVLAAGTDISGFVSQACLDLGREHAVLCEETLKERVEEAIHATGSDASSVLDESFGAPSGWLVFRHVVPQEPVPPLAKKDVFNALRPLPKIRVSLEGGIRLEYTNWLEGHPPQIRVYGDPQHTADVRIDGNEATCCDDGAYQAPSWDAVGSHSVWCAGTSKSYSVVPFEAFWNLWDAYAFPIASSVERSLTICGPIVRAALATEAHGTEFSISVPETNPVLLGSEPGQHSIAVRVSALRRTPRIASPHFRPIWALPRDPLHCDKENVRILFVGGPNLAESRRDATRNQFFRGSPDIEGWGRLILDASRKGMSLEPDTGAVRALWLSYKRLARRIWRAQR